MLVTITTLIGIIPHWCAGRVRFTAGALFGLAGVGGSLLGSVGNETVGADVLLLVAVAACTATDSIIALL